MASALTIDHTGGEESGVAVGQAARSLLQALRHGLRSLDLQRLHNVCPVDVL